MAEFKSLPLAKIIVADRLREIEEDHALVIAGSIAEYGLLNPITVRATPRAKGGSYTLVAGAHRLRAAELLALEAIDCVVLKADQSEAQLLEISENLHRNELSVIDRAVFVLKYRELWEARNGKIEVGRPTAEKLGQGVPNSLPFSEYTAKRLGLHPKTIKRLNQISQHLHADLRTAVRGTAVADNQSALLKLAKMEPAKQKQAAQAFEQEPDLRQVLAAIDDRPKPKRPDLQTQAFGALVAAWDQASELTKARFLDHIGIRNAVVNEASMQEAAE
ncbi:ParB N-terminal domain-containing protein [Roseibium polysiphoniae]|uniref:ParB N-terminal domain-containing protein n=1 Tax=Roseibium polysiphoniae TaxID=2571221 RepID=A0ABR9CAS9_9HYPH|nr:ParB N-terminal domain-containing protein [Roseibium polysiphoniae]MBD8876185.1 ParB N-terminal domain-containing protein [Roseibium polysiphoniae]